MWQTPHACTVTSASPRSRLGDEHRRHLDTSPRLQATTPFSSWATAHLLVRLRENLDGTGLVSLGPCRRRMTAGGTDGWRDGSSDRRSSP